jgi:hypothetical protein
MRVRTITMISVGLLAAACQGTDSRGTPTTAAPPDGSTYSAGQSVPPYSGQAASRAEFGNRYEQSRY